ncbi:hypothetical protein TNCV_2458881 [Trichonephila clavipes]|nr:hypothetical protein TNCV_2458881 [Trichonephila clavipes]
MNERRDNIVNMSHCYTAGQEVNEDRALSLCNKYLIKLCQNSYCKQDYYPQDQLHVSQCQKSSVSLVYRDANINKIELNSELLDTSVILI